MKLRILTVLNVLLILTAVLPMVASALIAGLLYSKRSLDASSRRLKAVSQYLASIAAEQLNSTNQLILAVTKASSDDPGETSKLLESALASDRKIRLIYVLDSNLKTVDVAFSPAINRAPANFLGIDMSSDSAVIQTRRTGIPSWSESYLSPVDGTPVISLAVPFRRKVILAQIDLSSLRRLSDESHAFPGTTTTIVDNLGVAVFSTNQNIVRQRQNLWTNESVQYALKGNYGSMLENIGGVDSVVGFSPISKTNWAILAWEPRSSVLARTSETVRLMTVIAMLAAVLASILSFFVSRRLMRPLSRVIETTEKVIQGESPEPPRPSRIDEVGRLSEAVYRMGLEIRDRELKLIQSNEALRESEQKFRRFLDTAQEAIWAFDKDKRTSYVNPALCQLLGYSASEMIGHLSDEFVAPEELQEHRATIERRMQLEIGDYQRIFIAKDGRRVYTRVLASPILDSEGNFAGAIATMADVTAVIQHEAQIRELLERLQQQFDAMPTPCFSLDSEGRLVDVNPAGERLFGVQKADAVGKDLPGWFEDTRSRSRFTAWLMDDSFGGPALYTHLIDGQEVHCEWYKSAIVDASGEKIGILAMAQNISEKLEAENKIRRFNIELEQKVAQRTRELEESNRELESFSYSVSHDLRSPLRAIDGYASMLVADYRDVLNEDALECLDRIRKNAQRMGDLINDLLTLSRLGRQALNLEDIDLAEAAREAWKDLSAMNNLDAFTFQVEPNLQVRADYSLMKQVMLNLLSNAVKYTAERPNPQVKVGSFKSNGTAGFYVEDNGVGFDMAYAPKIFEVFQRAHSSHQYEGTGVGLAIVHRVVKKHQGDVWVRSEPGKGTTFFFTVGSKLAES